jgi:hypothetical protein
MLTFQTLALIFPELEFWSAFLYLVLGSLVLALLVSPASEWPLFDIVIKYQSSSSTPRLTISPATSRAVLPWPLSVLSSSSV